MYLFKWVSLVSCFAAMIAAGAGSATALPHDDCRNGDAFSDSEGQFVACDAALRAVSEARQKAFLQFKRAEALYWMDQPGLALDDLNLAIDADPQLIPAYIRRAWTHIQFQEWEMARRDIEEVLVQQPRNAEAIFALSYVYTSTEQNSARAFEAVKQAVEIDPDFHLARLNLAYKQYHYRGDLEAMLREFSKILEHDVGELDKVSFRSGHRRGNYPFGGHVRHERARYLMFANRSDEAFADANWLISHYPKIAPAYVLRGQILVQKNNRIDAIKDYSQAVELDPYNVDARRGKGWLLLDLERLDEALIEADWLVGPSSPARSDGLWLRAGIFKKRGDAEQALLDFEEAFRNDPERLGAMAERLADLGYVSRPISQVYTEEIRNGVRACIADPEC